MNKRAQHPGSIEEAATILRAGKICAFATETVYGLGADATNDDAVLAIYEAKGRPRFNPLIVHCDDIDMAKRLVSFSPLAENLAKAFWPGPLTMVLPRNESAGISDIVTAGLDTLAVRLPAAQMARDLIKAVGRPLAAPSANPSGKLSPTSAQQVNDGFAGNVPVLDGGSCESGVESTIIAVDGDRLVQLRAGGVTRSEISARLGVAVEVAEEGGKITAPGMLKSHYAPNASMRLNASAPKNGEAYLAFGPASAFDGPQMNLSEAGDLREAARNLFSHLHALDARGVSRIAVAPIPENGLGEAINDRLRRAAAPRDAV